MLAMLLVALAAAILFTGALGAYQKHWYGACYFFGLASAYFTLRILKQGWSPE